MKYTELFQLAEFFSRFDKLDFVKRIDDNIFKLSLNKEAFIFDLRRSNSLIYQANLSEKAYNAPFDFMLKKYFTSAKINNFSIIENNRILFIKTTVQKSYKSLSAKLFFEFTGKNTNVIITDENDLIIEALRHIDKSFRLIKPGLKLLALKPFKMDENGEKITNFQTYFKEKFEQISAKNLDILKNNKLSQINKKLSKFRELLNSLENEKDLLNFALDFRKRGELIFANLSVLNKNSYEFFLNDFEGNKLKFSLEESPKQSANEFYKKAKKLEQKAKSLTLQRENLSQKLDFFSNLKILIERARSEFELEILFPKNKAKFKEKRKENTFASFFFKDFKISVGKNERENEALLKTAKKDDLWFHVRDLPSAHALIYANKQKISEEVIEFAAKLCVSFSRLEKGLYWVDYTQKNFVKINKKASVFYTNFKSIRVQRD